MSRHARTRRKSSRSPSRAARRGRGLARQLLDLHLRRLAGLGVRTVFLEVDEDNEPALRLYRRAASAKSAAPGLLSATGRQGRAALMLRRDLV